MSAGAADVVVAAADFVVAAADFVVAAADFVVAAADLVGAAGDLEGGAAGVGVAARTAVGPAAGDAARTVAVLPAPTVGLV